MIKFNRSSRNTNKMERKFYQSWIAMRFRCSNSVKNKAKKNYFDRKITVCARWKNFNYFYIDLWDNYLIHYSMFGRNTELDRLDNNKGYYKLNCRWVNHRENTNNKRNRRVFNGKTLTEWAELLKVKRSMLAQRFYVYGWSIDRTLTV